MPTMMRLGVVLGAFGSSTLALAVPADAFQCSLKIFDRNQKTQLAASNADFQVARVLLPQAQEPGFQETASNMQLGTTLTDGTRLSYIMKYTLATNGTVAFQNICRSYEICDIPKNTNGKWHCSRPVGCPIGGIPSDPNSPKTPYATWTPVALSDELPQLNFNGMFSSFEFFSAMNGSFYVAQVNCKHLGTYP